MERSSAFLFRNIAVRGRLSGIELDTAFEVNLAVALHDGKDVDLVKDEYQRGGATVECDNGRLGKKAGQAVLAECLQEARELLGVVRYFRRRLDQIVERFLFPRTVGIELLPVEAELLEFVDVNLDDFELHDDFLGFRPGLLSAKSASRKSDNCAAEKNESHGGPRRPVTYVGGPSAAAPPCPTLQTKGDRRSVSSRG